MDGTDNIHIFSSLKGIAKILEDFLEHQYPGGPEGSQND
jgi:hypothetical protein